MADNPVKLIYFCIKTTKITNFVSSKLINVAFGILIQNFYCHDCTITIDPGC